MATVKIYGASDDLVEVEGDVNGCNEYGSFDKATYIHLSTGDVFKAEYTDEGVWKVDRFRNGKKKLSIAKEPHADGDDPDPYTDTVTITGDIKWVDVWSNWPPSQKDIEEKVRKFFEDQDDLSELQAKAVYESLFGHEPT